LELHGVFSYHSVLDLPLPLRITGFDIQALISGDEARAFEVFLITGKDGTGPVARSHPWDETFYVLKGPVVFGMGNQGHLIDAATDRRVSRKPELGEMI